ncbi:MAG: hypothetical protein ACE5G1_11175, partial [bacterium]
EEVQVKELVQQRLPKVKAPAYLQNRIRRILVRKGNRPGFWQLVQSLFTYQPVTTSFALAVLALLMILPAVQNLENHFDLFESSTKTAQFQGRIICLDCELSREVEEVVHDPVTHRQGLKANDGRIWTFVRGSTNTELFRDQKLLNRIARVSGIVFRNSQYIYVQEYKLL